MVAIKLVIHQHDVAKVQIIFETLIALEGIIRIMEESGAFIYHVPMEESCGKSLFAAYLRIVITMQRHCQYLS